MSSVTGSKTRENHYDVIIAGGGVVGASIARELSKYSLSVLVLEREADIGMGTTKANTGIVHSGFNVTKETVKGKLNIEANPLFDELTSELDIPFERNGTLMLAFDENDKKHLLDYKENAQKQGVPSLEWWSREKVLEQEPQVNQQVIGALYAGTGAIICPFQLNLALIESAAINGVTVIRGVGVNDVITDKEDSGRTKFQGVSTNRGIFTADYFINACGLYGDEIYNVTDTEDMSLIPVKGEYYLFDESYQIGITRTIAYTPNGDTKGVMVTPTTYGNLMVGPNSEEVEDKNDVSNSGPGLNEVLDKGMKLVPNLDIKKSIRTFSGLRASGLSDFHIGPSSSVDGVFHTVGINSPGLTAAPLIGKEVIDRMREQGLSFIEEDNYQLGRPKRIRLRDENYEKWQTMIDQESDFGQIICRCEHVTLGEIKDAIRRPVGARTLEGIKRRTKAYTGRCQGGFCSPRLVKILQEELNLNATEITYSGQGSEVLVSPLKKLWSKEAGDES